MSLSLWDIIVLAVVQGIAEFLPISSSAHLVIIARLLAPDGGQDLDIADLNIVLHGGTLLSILVFYWWRIWSMLGEDRRAIGLLIVGTIPAVILGLALKQYLEAILENTLLAGSLLLVTGTVLLWALRCPLGDGRYQQMSYWTALKIGIIQAAAILPGLSRSGLTISSGLSQGLSRQDAATFSFLLAIPVIAGACVLEGFDLINDAELHTPLIHLATGALISFVVGLIALWWLVSWLERGQLQYFAWWCYAVGIAVIIWQLWLPVSSPSPSSATSSALPAESARVEPRVDSASPVHRRVNRKSTRMLHSAQLLRTVNIRSSVFDILRFRIQEPVPEESILNYLKPLRRSATFGFRTSAFPLAH